MEFCRVVGVFTHGAFSLQLSWIAGEDKTWPSPRISNRCPMRQIPTVSTNRSPTLQTHPVDTDVDLLLVYYGYFVNTMYYLFPPRLPWFIELINE